MGTFTKSHFYMRVCCSCVLLGGATFQLVVPVMTWVHNTNSTSITTTDAFRWALAGGAYVFVTFNTYVSHLLLPLRSAAAMNVAKRWTPIEYIILDEEHPEFDLREQRDFAEQFSALNVAGNEVANDVRLNRWKVA